MRIWIAWGVFTLIYLTLNALGLFLKPGVPGMASILGWGIIMPILMIVSWWLVASGNRGEIGKWWLLGILSTAMFATAGILSVKWIGSVWATIEI
ncbi:hypothetical protein OAK81_01720 [Verrucomicrobiales bacterium]|nr:hypothetical protein [Verrucomicrobiales bacterium]MDC0291990.1 hypothetical protein [Verrucomicrobiales bacterium]